MEKKKVFIIIGVILAIILLIACSTIGEKTGTSNDLNNTSNDASTIVANAQKESNAVKDSEKKDFTQIDVDKYLDYYKGEENTLILIARPTCHYCQIAEPIIQNIAYKYDININYLNTDEFKDDDQEKLVNSDDTFTNGFGTPLLLVVSNNKIVDSVDGLTDNAHYTEFFKKYGYIKEN